MILKKGKLTIKGIDFLVDEVYTDLKTEETFVVFDCFDSTQTLTIPEFKTFAQGVIKEFSNV